MSDRDIKRYARWMTGSSQASVDRALSDLKRLVAGRRKLGNHSTAYTQAGLSKRHYDKLRHERDDLDYREWNEDTGYSGVGRWPTGPGEAGATRAETAAEVRRRLRRRQLDEGF